MKLMLFSFTVIFLVCLTPAAYSDTVYLKNGRHIEGLIEKDGEDNIVLDVGFGTIKFMLAEIEKIYHSDTKENEEMQKDWKAQRKLEEKMWAEKEKRLKKERLRRELEPQKVGYVDVEEHIVVRALLNKKVKASFLLDTGATVVLLSDRIAKKLKINPGSSNKDNVKVQTADGRLIDARFVILDNISIEGVEAGNVEAVVLMENSGMDIGDGLLGMSFLKRFNFQIDTVNKKLILKKRRL